MIEWSDIKLLQKQKNEIQLKLDNLIKSNIQDYNYINKLLNDALILSRNIDKVLRIFEVELKNNQIKKSRSGYEIKDKLKKVNKMKISLEKMINSIKVYQCESFGNSSEFISKKQ